MDFKDVLALVNAGFTAQQIGSMLPQQQVVAQPQQQIANPTGGSDVLLAAIADLKQTVQAQAVTHTPSPQTNGTGGTVEDILAKLF